MVVKLKYLNFYLFSVNDDLRTVKVYLNGGFL